MGNCYDVAAATGKYTTRAVEALIRRTKKAGEKEGYDPSPNYKKRLPDGTTIFTWIKKWNPYRYDFDKELLALLKRNDNKQDEDHAYMLVAVCDQEYSEVFYNDPGLECFGDLCPGIIYPKEWYEDRSEKKYDIVLLEKADTDVLSRSDTEKLFAHLKCDEGYPLEIHDSMDHLVFGYITKDAADRLKWEFNSLEKSVCRILTMRDVQLGLINETEDHVYRHKGLKIWLGR